MQYKIKKIPDKSPTPRLAKTSEKSNHHLQLSRVRLKRPSPIFNGVSASLLKAPIPFTPPLRPLPSSVPAFPIAASVVSACEVGGEGELELGSMAEMKYVVKVEEATPTAGPVYRSVSAKDGFPPPRPGLDCCWDIFR